MNPSHPWFVFIACCLAAVAFWSYLVIRQTRRHRAARREREAMLRPKPKLWAWED